MNPRARSVDLWRCCFVFALLLTVSNAAAEPFFFIQLTDPQLGMFAKNENFQQETDNFEFAVATVNRLRPAFVVVTGDLINKPGDRAQTAEYQRIVGKVAPAIPVYNVAGNHDVGAEPTPESVTAWTSDFGPDHYVFRHRDFVGIVLNSNVIFSPLKARQLHAEQQSWLRAELEKARAGGAAHLAVFQHHSWLLRNADEPDQYFNIPRERRAVYLELFKEFGVKHVFCGHYHRNALAEAGGVEVVTSGPVGKPMGGAKSGLRIVIVYADRISHRYYEFGELPNRVELSAAPAETAK